MKLALIGDSILDNDIYVPEGMSVSALLEKKLPNNTKLIKLATDGATSADVLVQLKNMPDSITHALLSVGGNDALRLVPFLSEEAVNLNSTLLTITPTLSRFKENISTIFGRLSKNNVNILVLNIYNSIPNLEQEKKIILSIFNDIISEEAAIRSIPLIDLRVLLKDDIDYSDISPLEPSATGGKKIVNEIIRQLST